MLSCCSSGSVCSCYGVFYTALVSLFYVLYRIIIFRNWSTRRRPSMMCCRSFSSITMTWSKWLLWRLVVDCFTHMHTRTHTHTCTYAHTHMHAFTHMHTHTVTCTHMHTCTHTHTRARTQIGGTFQNAGLQIARRWWDIFRCLVADWWDILKYLYMLAYMNLYWGV